jgi:hypothetical protein
VAALRFSWPNLAKPGAHVLRYSFHRLCAIARYHEDGVVGLDDDHAVEADRGDEPIKSFAANDDRRRRARASDAIAPTCLAAS